MKNLYDWFSRGLAILRNDRRKIECRAPLSYRPELESLEDRIAPAPATILVDFQNKNVTPFDQLSKAIQDAEDGDTIGFVNAGGKNERFGSDYVGSVFLRLDMTLPTITKGITIDGFDSKSNSYVSISSSVLREGDGLTITNADAPVTIKNLVITRIQGAGIHIEGGKGGNSIFHNFLGVNSSGADAIYNGNSLAGIWIDQSPNNKIGNGTKEGRNYIGANTAARHRGYGIYITGSQADISTESRNNVITGNYIGVNVAGTGSSNSEDYGSVGIYIENGDNNTIGGSHPLDKKGNLTTDIGNGNVIANWSTNILDRSLDASQPNKILGNLVGFHADGSNQGNPSSEFGIFGAHLVGDGTLADANFVANSTQAAIVVSGQAVVDYNFVGSNTTLDGAANNRNSIGIEVQQNNKNQIIANRIVGFSQNAGIQIDSIEDGLARADPDFANVIEANLIGFLDNSTRVANKDGVVVQKNLAGYNTISGNYIAGNSRYGIFLNSSSRQTINDNWIGITRGNSARGNGSDGIRIDGGGSNQIGGTAPNTISGNGKNGITILNSSANIVQGNRIGTNAYGAQANGFGNTFYGILIIGSSNTDLAQNNIIGGDRTSELGNIISGNGSSGIAIYGLRIADDKGGSTVAGTGVYGNNIGTNKNGNSPIANGADGIYISSGGGGKGGITIGAGPLLGAPGSGGLGNVISANTGNGITIRRRTELSVQGIPLANAPDTDDPTGFILVTNNLIGVSIGANQAIPNTKDGILVAGTSGVIIGSDLAGSPGNIISGNTRNGITFDSVAIGDKTFVASNNGVNFNYIGANDKGNALANGNIGVFLSNGSRDNTLFRNEIGNHQGGAKIDRGVNNVIGSNLFYNNGGTSLAIELDNGGNNNIAAPTLTSATIAGGNFSFTGTVSLPGHPNEIYSLDFFGNVVDDPLLAEGQYYLGTATATTDADGNGSFGVSFPIFSVIANEIANGQSLIPFGSTRLYFTATVTATGDGTSTFASSVYASVGSQTNHAPVGADNTVGTTEDHAYTFGVFD